MAAAGVRRVSMPLTTPRDRNWFRADRALAPGLLSLDDGDARFAAIRLMTMLLSSIDSRHVSMVGSTRSSPPWTMRSDLTQVAMAVGVRQRAQND
jgi:hypothetical protein